MNAKDSVQAIHGVTHTDLAGESAARVKLVAQATKAATHPVAVIVTQNELLWAQNMLQLTEQTSGTSASGRRGMQNEFAYRTGLLHIDLSQITSAPLDSFAVTNTSASVESAAAGWMAVGAFRRMPHSEMASAELVFDAAGLRDGLELRANVSHTYSSVNLFKGASTLHDS